MRIPDKISDEALQQAKEMAANSFEGEISDDRYWEAAALVMPEVAREHEQKTAKAKSQMNSEELREYNKQKQRESRQRRATQVPHADWLADIKRHEEKERQRVKKIMRAANKRKKPRWVYRLLKREKDLPKNKMCAHCKGVQLNNRAWVVKKDWVGCLSCYRRLKK